MSYRKLERITLWFLTIILLAMFIFNSHTSNTIMDLNSDLVNLIDSNREQYDEVIEGYRTMVTDLKVENAELKAQIREMEESNE